LAQKRISIFLILAAAILGLAVTVLWKSLHGRSVAQQPYVGKWQFVSGQVKAGPGFPLGDKVAPDGTTARPMAGKSAVVEQRDGALWYLGDDRNCRYELHVITGAEAKAEVLPSSKIECDKKEPESGATPATTVRMAMTIDSQGQAHISGAARVSLDLRGTRRDVEFTYEGVAVRDAPRAQ